MHKSNKKFYCDVCQYRTNLNSSFKRHLATIKHMKNSRESSVKMDIIKFEDVNIEICGKQKEDINKSMDLIEKITNQLTELKQENSILKANQHFKRDYYNDYDDICINSCSSFKSVFDDDFKTLFN